MAQYVNLTNRQLQETAEAAVAFDLLEAKRGDTEAYPLVFIRDGVPVEIDADGVTLDSLKWGAKQNGHLNGDYVVSNWDGTAYAWTKTGGAKFTDGVLVGPAFATGTLTGTATAPSDGDIVTIGNKTYTLKTTLTPTEGQVLIGGSSDAALLNLARAINHTGTPDTDYSCAAAHTQVSASETITSHAFGITALVAGAAGNSYVTTETSAQLSWGGATMAGGVTALATLTSATAGFMASDVGLGIGGIGIAADTTILSVQSATSVTLSAAATATGSGVTITFTGRVPTYSVAPNFNFVALNDLLVDGDIAATPASQAARYALTGLALGTIVRQTDDQTYWKVIDILHLADSAGWSQDVPTKDYVDLDQEVEWVLDGARASTGTVTLRVSGDIHRGGEGVPSDAPSGIDARVIPLQGTAAAMAAIVPLSGEQVYLTDTKETRVGDGTTAVASLPGSGSRVLKSGRASFLAGAGPASVTIGNGYAFPANSVVEISVLFQNATLDDPKIIVAGAEYDFAVTRETAVLKLMRDGSGNVLVLGCIGSIGGIEPWSGLHSAEIVFDNTGEAATFDYIVQLHRAG